MNRTANLKTGLLLGLGMAGLGGIAALAVQGWAEHGEALFVSLAASGWATCF